MRKPILLLLGIVALVLIASPSPALPTADDLFKQIAARTGEMKSLEADSAITGQSPTTGAMSGTGHMATEVTEKDGIKVNKMCYSMDMTVKQGDQERKMQQKKVNDGEFIWNEMRDSQRPGVHVMKTKANHNPLSRGSEDIDPSQWPQEMKKDFGFKVVGEDTIDGQKMYVLEGTPKKDAAPGRNQPAKLRMLVNEKDLIMRRWVALDADGKEIMTMNFANLKVNQPINSDLFKYTPPPGAVVTDLTTP